MNCNTTHYRANSSSVPGDPTLLSLHPKSQPEQYRFLESEYGVKLLQEPLGEVLPAADVFTATFSSTVRWAVLVGIPTLVFDFYGFNFDIYDHLKGVVKVTGKVLLSDTLCRMLNDHGWYEQLKHEQLQAAQQIALFDGQANRRIIDLIADGNGK